MSRCEFRSAPLQVGEEVLVQGVIFKNDTGQYLVLCQAMMSLLPKLNLSSKLGFVVCGLMHYQQGDCPIGRYYQGDKSQDLRAVFNEYTEAAYNLVRENLVRRMTSKAA